ncbi:hypothetical protein JCM10908_001912 [Rhodotorula pacifica]|uniref:uncharacterized protein n=1 Tax=Rhodotorula pacifica TaxID=1495444 RepID=UPI00317690A3
MFSSSSSSSSSSQPQQPAAGSGPSIDVFVTSILSNPAIRGRHERTRRALTSARVPYREHDVAGDEEAKKLWKRKNGGKNELPFVLVDGEPVGSIEDMDEAVEFGELRQFLRLDTPRIAPPAAAAPPSDPSTPHIPAPPPSGSSSAPIPAAYASTTNRLDAALSKQKPSPDDFADLDLTEEELASLAKELTSSSPEETYSSLLSASQSRGLTTTSTANHPHSGGYNFSHHTQQFTPSYPSTAPLKLEKINFVRPIQRKLHGSEGENDDVLEGIDQDGLDEDALEKLARELELEDEEHRRARDRRKVEEEGALRGQQEMKTVESEIAPPLADVTAVEGDGGASLSRPLKEVEALTIPAVEGSDPVPSSSSSATRNPDRAAAETAQIQVEPVSEFETRARAEAERAAAAAAPSSPSPGAPTATATTSQARQLKQAAAAAAGHGGAGAGRESEMPSFGVEAMMRPSHSQEGSVERRVAEAIRGGDL